MKSALIVVDLQNDFLPGGKLPVPDADQIIPVVNKLMEKFSTVFATVDWHPPDHASFKIWPEHCVAFSNGASHPKALRQIGRVFTKGEFRNDDSYSGFYRAAGFSNGLHQALQAYGITDVYICGLATEYCVKATALDAVKLGYKTKVFPGACRGLSVNGEALAMSEMRQAGVDMFEA